MGFGNDQIGTFDPRLIDAFAGLDPVSFGNIVFGQHDPVSLFGFSSYDHGNVLVFRMLQAFNGCKIIVQITMQYGACFHMCHPPVYKYEQLIRTFVSAYSIHERWFFVKRDCRKKNKSFVKQKRPLPKKQAF